ncbi:MAG TPA: Uma2 family endonuclease [Bacteroidetes bacterium]|nr:Uma2 family endonuclease [Bacteroidota bacterium]
MFDDKNIVATILKKPGAMLILQQVNEKLKEEKQRRQEFYESITEEDKAEFINGEIVYHSPVVKEHNDATGHLYKLIHTYVGLLKLGYVGIEKILTRFTRNDYEPDICYFNLEKSKGFKKGQMFFPVPDLAVEVLSKSKKAIKRDTETKFEDYELHGVSEYWLIDPREETVEQHVLKEGKYRLVMKSGEGTLHSYAITGFSIPVRAIFDEEANLAALRELLK